MLHTVSVNTGVASAVLTLYDGTSTAGNVIAVVNAANQGTLTFDCILGKGLYVVLAGANADVTIVTWEVA